MFPRPFGLRLLHAGQNELDGLNVSGRPLDGQQIFRREPADLGVLGELRFARKQSAQERCKDDDAEVVFVLRGDEVLANLGVDEELLFELAVQCLLRCLARLDLSTGELPETRQRHLLAAPGSKNLAVSDQDCRGDFDALLHVVPPGVHTGLLLHNVPELRILKSACGLQGYR